MKLNQILPSSESARFYRENKDIYLAEPAEIAERNTKTFNEIVLQYQINNEGRRMATLIRCGILLFALLLSATQVQAEEVIVTGGIDEVLSLMESDNWWQQRKHDVQLKVPHTIIVAISERWQKNASQLPVSTKKDIFYSCMLPLALHANTMVMDRRKRLEHLDEILAGGKKLSPPDETWLRKIAELLRIDSSENVKQIKDAKSLRKIIDQALYKLDVIPPGLVLGQGAYESGYGTSRFAVKGNSLFGQWTFGGTGLVPEQQRKQLGDHRIASYDWPFDSVRGYFINLSSHPSYEEFRRIRAELKAAGKPLTCLALAEGLKKYSERGQAYVNTLKGIIRTNKLDLADGAVFRDEPMRFFLGAADQASAAELRNQIEEMRKSGELEKIIEGMQLE